ncbi:MAG: mechanosensitive ion channel family protein [Bacteroidota bacterium]|uniref:Potassium efflux system KefA protein n=1 Tax=Christiangramia flava JLT2011 TaxID=1229726 RepID=A0A1L7HZR3_9FLAO|nr:mechanosensitive ion channel family protein [Christiangramia flava]APU66836.1 Potassium efflux system KefA protein [Christiangramia flava JLT2011]MEE2773027.1 mechanosensitive ion channel family protein [Bacteroidota bacterium]OSS38473.1 Potassium efflux system KefA protein / Small-conductance mechanosensitive channel [Christiangramia flava JLT2011]
MILKFDIQESIKGIWEKLGGWLDTLILNLPNFLLAIIVFIAFIFIARYAGKLFDRVFRKQIKQDSIRLMAVKVLKAIIILIGFFIALGLLNLDKVLTSVLAGAGVVGLAIGLALQGTLNNTFSGVILSFLPELQIGDWVETNGYAGSVTEINLRNIVIKQSDNNYVVIPNSKIVEEPFKNFTRTARSRIFVNCGVGYESNLEMVEKLTLETIRDNFPQRGNEEVEFMYTGFGDSSINYVVRFWADVTKNRDILVAQHKAIIEIKKAYDAQGVNIPFPIRTIDFKNSLNLNKE